MSADDPIIGAHDEQEVDSQRARRAATLFDLRRMIGGLFLIYGVILFVLGLGASDAEIEKAAGWNLNLWVGVAMVVVAILFLAWAFMRPLTDELEDAEDQDDDRTVRGAPAPVGPDAAALSGTLSAKRPRRRDRGEGSSGTDR
jgi:hypothetical protein